MKKWTHIAIGGGVGLGVLGLLSKYAFASEGSNEYEPDLPMPPAPGSSGYKHVDAIMDKLKSAAADAYIPLGLMVGWIARESGGRIGETTKYDERGFFQLMPDESKALGLDHQRLSTDVDYSIHAGVLLIQKYAKTVDSYGFFTKGSSAYWRLVKLVHTVGGGDTKKFVDGAKDAGKKSSWQEFEDYALSGAVKTKHSAKKWFPLVDKIYEIGKPFGFGDESAQAVAGMFDDDPVPSDVQALARVIESAQCNSVEEQQAVGWAVRNRTRSGLSLTVACDELMGGVDPTEWSQTVACAILSQPANDDPTNGALDFWRPEEQRQGKALGDLYRSHIAAGNAMQAGNFVDYKDFGSEEQVRLDFKRRGMSIVGYVGTLELMG